MFLFFKPPGITPATPLPSTLLQIIAVNSPDWTSLHFKRLFKAKGLAPSTHKRHLTLFIILWTHTFITSTCIRTGTTVVCYSLGQLNLAHTTIKVYLSSFRNLHIFSGHFNWQPTFSKTRRDIKLSQDRNKPLRFRLLITSYIMYKIKSFLTRTFHD